MIMTKAIEVGRAVLASSTQHLELWLTTLVTISPSQHLVDIQQLSSDSIFRLFSSGNVWVGRGKGMRMEIQLTLRGEPLSFGQLQNLTNNIIAAPIWPQLKLVPTLSTDLLQPGMTHIALNLSDNDSSIEERNSHRILKNVPNSDLKPPESIPRFELNVVHFSMDILEAKPRPRLKRSKTPPAQSRANQRNYEYNVDRYKDPDVLLHDMDSSVSSVSLKPISTNSSLAISPMDRKRKRSGVQAQLQMTSSRMASALYDIRPGKDLPASHDLQSTSQNILSTGDAAEVQLMVDGAMRLSIYGSNKTAGGLKVKANTFKIGLADVAPALWRPGYLVALSHRAKLLPTISRSLSHVASGKGSSILLAEKVRKLPTISPLGYRNQPTDAGSGRNWSSISDNLWRHLQTSLFTSPTPPLQAFVSWSTDTINQVHSDEILEHVEICNEVKSSEYLDVDTNELGSSTSSDTMPQSNATGLSKDCESIHFSHTEPFENAKFNSILKVSSTTIPKKPVYRNRRESRA
ncbi:hypothetical protein GQ44DRAFT_756698 [Phaeosphaeriaceae sp. PMI808]|nr:hypothetical protein GQ44DRAFT_756698 [Phaeosphaeriaceae sp. PMI808]